VSVRHGSFLESVNISLADFIRVAFLWSHRLPVETAVTMMELSHTTIIQWFSKFRDVCSHHFEMNDRRIGGEGHIVEIDESVFSRRKYRRGRLVRERWVFGGIDTTTRLGFLSLVEARNAQTLLPIIEQYVSPGTEIWTDGWAAYGGIAELEGNYTHRVVNHSENFVDPEDGTTTNHIERMWCEAKRRFKKMNGTTDEMLPGHLDEFMWRQRRGKTAQEAMYHLIEDIATWYSVRG
jgi:transposase-like protein